MSLRHAAIAANRLGLGARPGEIRDIAADPREWVRQQLTRSAPEPDRLDRMPSTQEAVLTMASMRGKKLDEGEKKTLRMEARDRFTDEMGARAEAAVVSDRPVRERLVRFWSNHFAVSTSRKEVRAVCGPYERECIRPRICGRFEALLVNAERHPAMQVYLDNTRSIGPNSLAGQRSGRGLNENHAREILELHTLGVDGGYTQADVEAFAAILTGWGLVRGRGEIGGGFTYDPVRHEPGPKRFLGQTYPEAGEDEGRLALKALAHHPHTARFVCTKLVRHLVDDDPPLELVSLAAQRFLETEGDLRQVYLALVDHPALWERTLTKLKTPEELVISTARALGYETEGRQMLRSVDYLGQQPFGAPSPQGWPDVAMEWLGPEAVLGRVEWADRVARDASHRVDDPVALARDLLGPTLSERTADAIAQAPTKSEGLALFLASPEFQRR